MGEPLKVLGSDFDTLVFERAYIAEAPGGPAPRAVVSGVECNIESKASHLAAGLAFCEPVEARWAENWPVHTDVLCNGVADRWRNMTSQERIVRAARRFAELELAGKAEVGVEL